VQWVYPKNSATVFPRCDASDHEAPSWSVSVKFVAAARPLHATVKASAAAIRRLLIPY
jgi:hypothetical protein